MTYQVDVLNPKATKLLKDLADLNLISLKKSNNSEFLKIVKRIRKKATKNPLSFEEISKEVELVRAKRYAHSEKE